MSDRVTVRGTWLLGPLPTSAGGLGLVFDTSRNRYVRGSFGASLTQEVFTQIDGRLFGFALSSLHASVCAGTDRGIVALAACAGAQFGLVYAVIHTSTLEPIPPLFHGWLAATVSARATVHLVGPLVLDASAELSGALIRNRFQIETRGERLTVFEQPLAGAALHLALRGTFR